MRSRIAAAVLLLPLSLAGCMSLQSGPANRTTVPAVERRVDAALPIGSTRQEIEAWLTEQGIKHSYSDLRYLGTVTATGSTMQEAENGAGGTISGIIRDTDRSFFVAGNIQLIFALGKDGRLTERWVKWVGIGP